MSQVLKADVKINTYRGVGQTFESLLEGAEHSLQQLRGGMDALKQAAKGIHALSNVADKELDEGAIQDLNQFKIAKRYIAKAAEICESSSKQVEFQIFGMAGKVEAYRSSVDVVKKLYDKEHDKIKQLREALERGDLVLDDFGDVKSTGERRTPGVRPESSIAAQRKAEEKPAKKAARKKKEVVKDA